ncbi:MAG TPA: endonuclease MutS2, partial [Firmicutes bacterium]|nr:endonuclease MutS2 [Bacillota bacterium]
RNRLLETQGEMAFETEEEVAGEPVGLEEIQPGVQVQVSGFTEPGTVLELQAPDNNVLVQIGAFKLRTEVSNLRSISHRPKAKRALRNDILALPEEKARSVSHEVDLRGMTREEAFLALDKYLDDAFLASLPQIRIIHGKGTGALRKAVDEYLRSRGKYVAGYRMGEASEGGTGVTVAKLKV